MSDQPADGRAPERRTFTDEYKAMVLRVTDELPPEGLGRFLQQEGLSRSHLVQWRRERRRASEGRRASRGRPPKPQEQGELERLQREHARLTKELENAHLILEIQKKLADHLGVSLGDPPPPHQAQGH